MNLSKLDIVHMNLLSIHISLPSSLFLLPLFLHPSPCSRRPFSISASSSYPSLSPSLPSTAIPLASPPNLLSSDLRLLQFGESPDLLLGSRFQHPGRLPGIEMASAGNTPIAALTGRNIRLRPPSLAPMPPQLASDAWLRPDTDPESTDRRRKSRRRVMGDRRRRRAASGVAIRGYYFQRKRPVLELTHGRPRHMWSEWLDD